MKVVFLQLLIRLFLQIHFDETYRMVIVRLLLSRYFVIFLVNNKLTFYL